MMNMIYSSEPAELLNEKVREKVSQQLFMFCNINTSINKAFSAGEKFREGILNLYKYTNDATCIVKELEYVYCERIGDEDYNHLEQNISLRQLNYIRNTVSMLRSVIAHNNDPRNGFIERNNIEKYQIWISRAIGKSEIESEEDFAALLPELEKLGSSLFKLLDSFVELVALSHENKKEEIVKRWEEKIFRWYTTKEDIFLGQLGDLYYSRAIGAGRQQQVSFLSRKALKKRLCAWIYEYFHYPIGSGEEGAEERRKIEMKVRSLCQVSEEKPLADYDYYQYFFRVCFKEILEKAHSEKKYNMISHELIQGSLKEKFDPIPSRDFA